jgi:hypothetical protein
VLRRPILLLIGALLLVLSAVPAHGQGTSAQPGAATESGSPINDQGSNFNYRSNITSVTPNVPGVSLQVLEFADRLLLRNHSGRTVTIYGYSGEPYARVLANGTAEQNVRSPATYLNANFYADVVVPPIANPDAPPKWVVVDRTGQFEWHDHRIHWMAPTVPPEVTNKGKRTLIFNWQVPIEVGARKGAVAGQLFWSPENSKVSVAVIVLGALIVVLGLLFVLFVRRRRARTPLTGQAAAAPEDGGGSPGEAW